MLDLRDAAHVCSKRTGTPAGSWTGMSRLLLWLAAILGVFSLAPAALAQAPPCKTPKILPQLLTVSRVVSLTEEES